MTKIWKMTRRGVLRSSLLGGAALAAPAIVARSALAKNAKKILFVSEESNPHAQAIYNKLNKKFEAETGISVTMEYPGFDKISQRVATLIAAGTPPELVWYGDGSAMQVAIENQLADVHDLVKELNIPDNLRLVVNGHDYSVATSQQFVYGWYRSDLFEKAGVAPYTDWDNYLKVVSKLNNPPGTYGNLIPAAQTGASHLLMQTMMQKNDAHWFTWDDASGDYKVALDDPKNLAATAETLDFLAHAHKSSPEASNYSWGDLMSQYFTGRVANSYYVGARLLLQVQQNAPTIAPVTKPISLPPNKSDSYYVSVQGFHVGAGSNVDGAKAYIKYFMTSPDYIEWLHSVPLHIIPAKLETLNSAAYQNNAEIQKRMDVLKFIASIWGKGKPSYYWDGTRLNPYIGLYENDNLGGWMLAERIIAGRSSKAVIQQAADTIRKKKADFLARKK